VSLFDEQALRAFLEQVVENAVKKALRSVPAAAIGDDQWVRTADLATQYSIAQGTLRRWIRQGRIEAKLIGGSLRVNRASFERLLAMPHGAEGRALSPEELADRDEIRERRSKKA